MRPDPALEAILNVLDQSFGTLDQRASPSNYLHLKMLKQFDYE